MASDGIWDVMENIEVINFIDTWKGRCDNSGSCEYPANINNSTISRLLCEEARYRWLGIAQHERIAIDDISCVVIDFGINDVKESMIEGLGEKKLVKLDSTSNVSNYEED
jgi:serine/threonine protein phosphatase PrpC